MNRPIETLLYAGIGGVIMLLALTVLPGIVAPMNLESMVIVTSLVHVLSAGFFGWSLRCLVVVRDEKEKPSDYGRNWLGYMLFILALATLPRFVGRLDIEYLARFLVFSLFFGGLSFGAGWLYGRYKSPSNEKSSAPVQTVPSYKSSKRPSNSRESAHGIDSPALLEQPTEDQLYETAWAEIENNETKKSLWAKIYAECDGDSDKTKARYIAERVNELRKELGSDEKSNNRRIEYATLTLIAKGYEVIYNHDHNKWHIWKKSNSFWMKRTAKNLKELESMAKYAKKYPGECYLPHI